MNVKFSHASTAFSHDPTAYGSSTQHQVKELEKDWSRRRKKGQPERLVQFDKAVPSCDCGVGGKRSIKAPFKQTSLKLGTKDICFHCGYFVRWTRELFLF